LDGAVAWKVLPMCASDSRLDTSLRARSVAIVAGDLTNAGAAVMLSDVRTMRALRYLALMSRLQLVRSAAQPHR
jgi:hypothetical protein